jgi:transposase
MTAVDDDGNVETFDHDVEKATRTGRRAREVQKRMSSCRTGSRRWKRRQLLNRRLRGKLARQRRHQRRSWANRLTHRYDTVCIEGLKTRNMTRSARAGPPRHPERTSARRAG